MKNLKSEECAFFDELDTEQPCCYCFDNIHFEEQTEEYAHPTEKGGVTDTNVGRKSKGGAEE